MGDSALRDAMLAAMIGLLSSCLTGVADAQSPKRQAPSQQANISDKELRAFAKAYVAFHKIRQAYEPSLRNAKGTAESEKIQQEANAQVTTALKKQGLDVASYNRIFTAVNANEELRKKALRLISEERKNVAS